MIIKRSVIDLFKPVQRLMVNMVNNEIEPTNIIATNSADPLPLGKGVGG
jgi:hypothetical protein